MFTTSLTGYTESLSDPSYCGQILVFTNPLIGNYGFERHRMESAGVQVAGVVISELARLYSNPQTRLSLHSALVQHGVPGIEGVDTREITILLRTEGSQNAILSPRPLSLDQRRRQFSSMPDMEGLDLSPGVTVRKPVWHRPRVKNGMSVALVDFGVKRNIIQEFLNCGVSVLQLPATASPEAILSLDVRGLVLSNGPGDPAAMTDAVERIRCLLGRLPIFGICLGHQLLALAGGLKTFKLKFGHRGTNHPVQDLQTRSIAVTTQNHGFSVKPPTAAVRDVRITHRSLYDGTVEGLDMPGVNAFSVQYHPEATPGPHDSLSLFERFLSRCGSGR